MAGCVGSALRNDADAPREGDSSVRKTSRRTKGGGGK